MKQLIILTLATLTTAAVAVSVRTTVLGKNLDVDPNLLEMAHPIDGTIDVEFLKENFGPAYEQ